MKNKNIALLATFAIGVIITPITYASNHFVSTIESVYQAGKTVSFSVNVSYLGKPVDGASVAVIKEGKSLAESKTDAKGNVTLKIDEYKGERTTLQIQMEGYKTQVLTG